MKKIKTINKLISSLTLLSPLVGIGFNNQYQNTQNVITENTNDSLSNYVMNKANAEPVQMGDIYVNLDDTGKIIQSYASGEGELVVPNYITEVADQAFNPGTHSEAYGKISSLDLTNATSLTTIGNEAFMSCFKFSDNPDYQLKIPANVRTIRSMAFFYGLSNFEWDIIFLSKTPPSFESQWIAQNTFISLVYVPSEQAKQDYLKAPNFTLNEDQIAVSPSTKSNLGLILALLFGLGIPIILAIAFIVWYLTKKKKTTVKI